MWQFDSATKKYFNDCNMIDKCCYYCKNRLNNSCIKSCFDNKQEIELTEKYNRKFDCRNCKHK